MIIALVLGLWVAALLVYWFLLARAWRRHEQDHVSDAWLDRWERSKRTATSLSAGDAAPLFDDMRRRPGGHLRT